MATTRNYTDKQKALVKDAWAKIEPNAEKLGKNYFTKIFEKDPSLKDKFAFLKEDSAKQYASPVDHPRIKAHAAVVMKMIADSAVQISDNGKVKIDPSTLNRMAKTHHANNVAEKDFPIYADASNDALNDYFTEDHGDALSQAHDELILQMQDAQAHVQLLQNMRDDIGALMSAAVSGP